MVSISTGRRTQPAHAILVAASVILTQYRTRLRRQMNDRDVVRRVSILIRLSGS